MIKTDAITVLLDKFAESPFVFSTGFIARLGAAISPHHNFYMTGSMGLASSVGYALSRSLGELVVVVDGDGSALMGLASLTLAEDLGPARLVHVVLNDGRYESTGAQPAPRSHLKLADIARACGYRTAISVRDMCSLENACASIHSSTPQLLPVFVDVHVERSGAMAPRVDGNLETIFQSARTRFVSFSPSV